MKRFLRHRVRWAIAVAVAALALPMTASADENTEVTAGQRVFRSQCMGCHSVAPEEHRAGPSLHGVLGRPAGSAPGFDYSPAMRDADIVWSEETLDRFLTDPDALVPGTIMVFWGLEAQDRARVIRYLSHVAQ